MNIIRDDNGNITINLILLARELETRHISVTANLTMTYFRQEIRDLHKHLGDSRED